MKKMQMLSVIPSHRGDKIDRVRPVLEHLQAGGSVLIPVSEMSSSDEARLEQKMKAEVERWRSEKRYKDRR
jgi:hypothetical protein